MALGRLGDPLDGDCVLVEAHDGDGRLRGFLSFVPWGCTGCPLDLMRRDPTADNGLVELMVASPGRAGAAFGVGPVSLNFAMFREAFERGARSVPGRSRGCGGSRCCWPAGTGSSSRSTARTPSTSPTGSRGSSASSTPRTCPGSGRPPGTRRASSRVRPRAANRRGRRRLGRPRPCRRRTTPPRSRRRSRAPRPGRGRAVRATSCPSSSGSGGTRLDRLRARGHRPVPGDVPAHAHARAGPRRAPDLPPDTATGRRVSVAGRVIRSSATAAAGLRDAARRQRRPAGDGRRPTT